MSESVQTMKMGWQKMDSNTRVMGIILIVVILILVILLVVRAAVHSRKRRERESKDSSDSSSRSSSSIEVRAANPIAVQAPQQPNSAPAGRGQAAHFQNGSQIQAENTVNTGRLVGSAGVSQPTCGADVPCDAQGHPVQAHHHHPPQQGRVVGQQAPAAHQIRAVPRPEPSIQEVKTERKVRFAAKNDE